MIQAAANIPFCVMYVLEQTIQLLRLILRNSGPEFKSPGPTQNVESSHAVYNPRTVGVCVNSGV